MENSTAAVDPAQDIEPRGFFLVFEGGDGAGKSSQIPELAAWFTSVGREVLTTREPGGTQIGESIRPLILDHGMGDVDPRTEALLYAAARAAHVEQKILPHLRSGGVVVCDRFVDSSVAYQSAGRELSAEDILSINAFATQGLVPDLTVLLDISPEEGRSRRTASRGGEDRIESESDDFHARPRGAFLALAEAAPERYLVIDATLSRPKIQELIRHRITAMLGLPERAGLPA
jgi:dTMP kinase